MRYERKYKIDDISLALLKQAILLHPASFTKIYPDRQINNIYFDTIGLHTFHQNVDGVAERKKYRVRWYNTEVGNIQQPQFEIKARYNQLGTKKIVPVSTFNLHHLTPLIKTVNQHSQTFNELRPVLLNSYMRSYYGTRDGQYRITIDRNLRYFSFLTGQKFYRHSVTDAGMVLEIKYDENLDDSTDRILQHIPFRQTKSSKYVTGVLLCTQ